MKKRNSALLQLGAFVFTIVAMFVAVRYLADGLNEGGTLADQVKGSVWLALACIVMLVEYLREERADPHHR